MSKRGGGQGIWDRYKPGCRRRTQNLIQSWNRPLSLGQAKSLKTWSRQGASERIQRQLKRAFSSSQKNDDVNDAGVEFAESRSGSTGQVATYTYSKY